MDTEIKLRKKAIRLWMHGQRKSEIARSLHKSRLWVHRWTSRYRANDPEESLHNHSSAPQHARSDYSSKIKEIVLQSRQKRAAGRQEKYRHALVGAAAIHYEMRVLGISPLPSIRTIHAWLKGAGLVKGRKAPIRKPPNPTYPILVCQAVNDIHQLDLKGPFYLQGSHQKHYLVALRDAYGKKVSLRALTDIKMDTIIDFVVASWQKMGRPKKLQMDNGLEFRGSNRYPRSLGKLLRVCLDLGVEPIFIPTHEPWRNGVIENLNGLINRLLLRVQHFQTGLQLERAVQKLETSINTTHRLPALDGKTPEEFAARARIRSMPLPYIWRKRDFRLLKGCVSYIRLVRKSGRITLTANDKFLIGKRYKWQYVLAQVNVQTKKLNIFLKNQLTRTFDYS